MLNTHGTDQAKYPHDFVLKRIGEYDEKTGKVKPHELTTIITGTDVVKALSPQEKEDNV